MSVAMPPWDWSRECLDWCGLADLENLGDLVSKDSVGMILLAFTVEVSLVQFGDAGSESMPTSGVPKDGRGGGDSRFILL